MARELQLFADFDVDDIDNPEIQEVLQDLQSRLDGSHGPAEVVTQGHHIHLGAGYADNNPVYTEWLFQAMSRLAKHTTAPSLECLICDSTGDWWSERVYPAA
jgi:hypothetical protein